ncbi:MAG TPA: DUF1294 domain-containing protein [Stenotrophomonas sp.]|jgi:uncharacterized membrane protein YsdA (DUF1294 family)
MVRAGVLPVGLSGVFAVLSVATVLVYARDKRAARRQGRRTPELTLQLLGLAGGWPGALLAQRFLRHKNRKVSFQVGFWACVLLHEAVLGNVWRVVG